MQMGEACRHVKLEFVPRTQIEGCATFRALARSGSRRYIRAMAIHALRLSRLWPIAALVLLAGAATGTAFAGWAGNGAAIFMALAETGLALCF